MRHLQLSTLILCLVATFSFVVRAQVDCPTLVKMALETAEHQCTILERNQACYGNIQLKVTPKDGKTLIFDKAGDIANVDDMKTLQLSSMSLTDDSWGVALMNLQANLPRTLPGQNVTFLLFGNVSVTDASDPLVELPVTAISGVNVRLRPSAKASVMKALARGQEVTAIGRLPDSTWIQVRLDDTSLGWVAADFLKGDIGRLLPTQPEAPGFGPMQAFRFFSGFDDRPCEQAPDSGILIQTPKGVGTIELRANNVDIQLGSTVYLQAVPSNAMYVNVIEGHAVLTSNGTSQVVPAGTVASIPLDANGVASGPPQYPQPYTYQSLLTLPVNSKLLAPVNVNLALTDSQIQPAIDKLIGSNTGITRTAVPITNDSSDQSNGPSGSGTWIQNETVTFNTCLGPLKVGDKNSWRPTLVFSVDRQTFTYNGGPNQSIVTLTKTGGSTYQGQFGEEAFTFNFSSSTNYSFSWVGVHGDPNNGGCRFVMEANATLVSGGS